MPGHQIHTFGQCRALLAAPLVGVLLVGLVACGSSDDDPDKSAEKENSKSSSRSGASPNVSPSNSQIVGSPEEKAALAAYTGFWDEQMKAYRAGSVKGTQVRKYAGGDSKTPAFLKLEQDLENMRAAGTRKRGHVSIKPEAKVTPKQKGRLPLARVTDCLDISKWETVKKKSGKVQPMPSNQPPQIASTARVEKWPEGWQVLDITPTTKKC